MGFPQRSSGRRSFGRSKRLSMARSLDDLEVRFLKRFSFSPDIDLHLSLSFSFILTYKISQHSNPINRRVGNDYIRNEWPTLYFRDKRHACKPNKTNTINPLDVRTLGALFTKQQLCACTTDLTRVFQCINGSGHTRTREFNFRPSSRRDRVHPRVMWRAHKCGDGRFPWQRRRRWNVDGVIFRWNRSGA